VFTNGISSLADAGVQVKPPRALTPQFKHDLQKGILAPLLDLIKKDRDLLLEIRFGSIDLYFKGNGLIKIQPLALGSSEYEVTSHDKFAAGAALGPLKTEANVGDLIKEIPGIKHRIATNKSYASEIEIEHLLIRMNNREPGVNSEYFAVDRQGVYGKADKRIDVLGVCWPRANRTTSAKLDLCVMEVKFAMGAKIGKIADQLKIYHEILRADIQTVARDAQALLRDKIELGLLGIDNDERLKKLKTLEISDQMEDVRCVIVLAEQNPYSKSLDPRSLSSVPFRRIEIFRVGFGLWSCDAYRLENGAWQRPKTFGETQ
jgi:hypothetical protein